MLPEKERHICASRKKEAWRVLLEKGKAWPMLAQEAKPCFPKRGKHNCSSQKCTKHNRDFRFFSFVCFLFFLFSYFFDFWFSWRKSSSELINTRLVSRSQREKSNDKNGSWFECAVQEIKDFKKWIYKKGEIPMLWQGTHMPCATYQH